MKLQAERELLVFTYIDQKGLLSLEEIRSALELKEDPDFDYDSTLNHLVQEEYLEQTEDAGWKMTEWGKIQFNDLRTEQYEDINKIPLIIKGILIVVAVLAFMKIFPRMFH